MKPQPESTGGRLSLIALQRRKWFSWAPPRFWRTRKLVGSAVPVWPRT